MKIVNCRMTKDSWGVYITPLIGYSWNPKEKSIWIGWLLWLWVIALEDSVNGVSVYPITQNDTQKEGR